MNRWVLRNAQGVGGAIEKLHLNRANKLEAPFWARNLQGNVFHLFYLSFLAGLWGLPLGLTTSLFMDFNQVCARQQGARQPLSAE